MEDSTIAYWSALNNHDITEQFPNSVFIQTTKRKKDKIVFGVSYKFIQILKSKIAGIEKLGFGNHSYAITDIEKTIVNCFDLTQYYGGYAELIRAFYQANLNGEKMILYCKIMNNIFLVKRTGYLADLLNKKGMKLFINFAVKEGNEKYNFVDTFGIEEGKFVNKWRLRLNIGSEEILDICNKQFGKIVLDIKSN